MVRFARLLVLSLVAVAAPSAFAQFIIPPGYREVVNLTNNPIFNAHPRINNSGQIVWESRVGGTDESGEIFLWENGATTRLTNDNVRDADPNIADDGTIVWTRFMGPTWEYGPTGEIMMRKPDGTVLRITDNASEEREPSVNQWGEVVWTRFLLLGCRGSWYTDIYRFDGQFTEPITTDGVPEEVSNQSPRINDHGDVVWTRYDFCAGPSMSFWEASIWLRQAGQSRRVSPAEQFQPQVPDINNEAQAVWFFDHYPQLGKGIAMWDDGLNRTVTDWGQNPAINDRGDLYFIRLHPTLQTYHPWLLLAGELIQLTDATRSTDGDIANTGDVVWRFGPTFQSDILYLKRFSSGDLNCDGALDAFDIESFINAMLDPAGYRSAFPTCDPLLADVNEDGAVDAFDIEPFIALLIP